MPDDSGRPYGGGEAFVIGGEGVGLVGVMGVVTHEHGEFF